jgi:hypothetical protein
MTQIETVTDLVRAFGGTGAMADWVGTTDACVSLWKNRGCLPGGYHLRVLLECQRRGFKVSPKLFELEGPDAKQFRVLLAPSSCSAA